MATTNHPSPQLRPLGVGEVLDASFKVVRQSFGTLALCVLVVAVPLNIVITLITASTSENAFSLESQTTSTTGTGTQLAGTLLTTTLGLLLTTLAAAACFHAVSRVYLGQRSTVGESLGFAAGRTLPLIWLSIFYYICLIPAFLLLVLPGIWLAVAWSLSFPALLSERLGAMDALKRSFRLVKGRWWATFAAVLVMSILVGVISAIVGALFAATLISGLDSELLAGIIYTIANILSSLVTLPLFAAVLAIIYFDLRVRKEGFDLELLARGVGEESGHHDTSPQSVGAAAGLGDSYGNSSSAPPPSEGGFSPPQAPPRPAAGDGMSDGDPLREPDGGTPR